MADNRRLRFREMLPAHVLQRIDEQGPVPMFSPSVVAASVSAGNGGGGGGDSHPSSSRAGRPRPRSPTGFDRGDVDDSNKENSPYVRPALALTTPTPRKSKMKWGATPPSRSSPASQETAFFSPVAGSVAEMMRLLDDEVDDDDDDDDDAGHPMDDKVVEATGGGDRNGRQQQQQPPKDPNLMDESLTPFSGITHSTGMPPTVDVRPAATMTSGASATPRRLNEFQSAFTPTGAPSSSKGRASLMSVSASNKGPQGWRREAAVGSSPYKSLPRLDMLTSSYLKSCTDAPTLRRIIRVLKSDGEHAYPRLLELATSRLDVVLQMGNAPRPTLVVHAPSPGAARHDGNHRHNDSLTLSTDTGDELSSLQLLKESLEKQARYPYPRPSTSSFMVTQYSPSNAQQANLMQQRLRQTEDQLQRTVQEVEGLQQLLQSTSLQHDQSTTELRDAITTLQSQLDRQRASNEQSRTEAATYRTRAEELTHRLETQTRDHDRVRTALEEKQRQLSEFLRASQRNADGVTNERTEMLRRMVTAMSSVDAGGATAGAQVEKLTKEERRLIVADFCAHLADSKSQLEELAAMVRETEKERRKILKAYKQVKEHYIETHNCMVGLERDNHILSNEIEHLAQQLKEAQRQNADIESKQSGWDKRQQDANAVIRRLKEQIRTTEAMVPIGVYKSALENADVEAAKAEEYRSQVASLTKQVASLSARLTSEGKAPPPPPPPSSTRALQPKQPSNAVHRNPFRPHPSPKSVTPLENKKPLSINTFQPNRDQPGGANRKAVSFAPDSDRTDEPPKSAPKSESKIARVRAAGGRKALEEQLRKARSPRNQLP